MSPIRMERFESVVRVVLSFNEAFNRHDVEGMMQLVSDDCVFEHSEPTPDGVVYKGKEAATQLWQGFFNQSPQAHIEIEDIFGLGIRCVLLWRYDWVDEAGDKRHVRGVDIYQVKNGIICKRQSYVKA